MAALCGQIGREQRGRRGSRVVWCCDGASENLRAGIEEAVGRSGRAFLALDGAEQLGEWARGAAEPYVLICAWGVTEENVRALEGAELPRLLVCMLMCPRDAMDAEAWRASAGNRFQVRIAIAYSPCDGVRAPRPDEESDVLGRELEDMGSRVAPFAELLFRHCPRGTRTELQGALREALPERYDD